MPSALLRFVLIAVSLLAGAWLVLSLRALDLESNGRAALSRALSGALGPGEAGRGLNSLRRAQRFSADKNLLINESLLLAATGRPAEALAVAERLVEAEPDNLDGWIFLYRASSDPKTRDPKRAAQALDMVRTLNPLAVDALRSASPTFLP